MCTQKYGKVFQRFREEKGISRQDAADGILTVQQLVRFENGQSEITMMRLSSLLIRLKLSWSEFVRAIESPKTDDCEQMYEVMKKVEPTGDIRFIDEFMKVLKEKIRYWKDEDHIYKELLALAEVLKDTFSDEKPTPDLVDMIQNALNHVESWGTFEYWLFGNSVYVFDVEQLLLLFNLKGRNLKRNLDKLGYSAKSYFFGIATNVALKCYDAKYYKESLLNFNYALSLATTIYKPDVNYTVLLILYYRGLARLKLGDEDGVEDCQLVINFYKQFRLANEFLSSLISMFNDEKPDWCQVELI